MKIRWKKRIASIILPVMVLMLGGCEMTRGNSNGGNYEENLPGGDSVKQEQDDREAAAHLLAMTDMAGGIRVIDLDAEDPASEKAIVWEWKPDAKQGWKLAPERVLHSLDDVKLRWSEYYQKDVVIMTASNNWAGIADYTTGECLWEADVPYMPHAIEMLPDGDIVIGGSGGNDYMTEGCVMYYDITSGDNCMQTDRQLLSSTHGLAWDPKEGVLWATGWERLVAYRIKDKKLELVEGKGCKLLHTNGHDLSMDYYDHDQLFMTVGDKVYKFSKAENKLLISYNYSDLLLNSVGVKGITSFADGTVAYSMATGVVASYDTDTIYVIRLDEERGVGVQEKYIMKDFSTYKVKNFTDGYQ